ncbi:threonine-phosphate decarboxylase CobD [Sulfitobacter mediterraneus]|uniref:threonine-phosphate decarboxylase n=1 Tax=Sulfitobacter mediterraneus TaxID=83219 RepID=A0A061SUD6_9RHOB|nr:threonine-phosphate decarboxylase CobD [Sulfitobacter mediterraneus]KAJ04567.1 alpha-ribazole phosphatase [Sulfitobacter mediterraneus]
MDSGKRDHGGGLDAAAAQYGGQRGDWLDLSTGINPVPYPLPEIPENAWTALPDEAALSELESAARRFWKVPEGAAVMAVPGASAAIVHIPHLAPAGTVHIPGPTYNEHAASFAQAGWRVSHDAGHATASVHVHPNNPTGQLWQVSDLHGALRVIDESFCDVTPDRTLMDQALTPGTLILKSFGKFWGLAGVRLGFVIGDPDLVNQLRAMLGPWAVAGPALTIGADALRAQHWAEETRNRLHKDALRLDALVTAKGAKLVGGTDLFRLYEVENAAEWQETLAQHHIWSRIFPYNPHWLRLGLPAPDQWARIEKAML